MRDYIGKKILLKGMRCWQAVTRISLKKERSAGGIEYSRAVFSLDSVLSPEQMMEAKQMADTIKETTRAAVAIDEADYDTDGGKTKMDKDGFVKVDGPGPGFPG